MEVFPNLPDPRFEKGKKASGKKAETPFLDEYGRDLKKQALDAKSPIKPERKAESLALTNALSAPSRKSVLFICDNFETVRAIVIGALYSALSQKNKHLFKERRIDDISFFKVDEDDEQRTRLQRILTEMDKRQDLILMLPSLDRHAYSREKKEGWVDILQTVLRRGNNQVICHTTPDVYEDFIKKDSGLIKLFHRLWISKENSKDIPYEI
jgi:ATP-dependent Clp protease ATP-binding subunit ClpC